MGEKIFERTLISILASIIRIYVELTKLKYTDKFSTLSFANFLEKILFFLVNPFFHIYMENRLSTSRGIESCFYLSQIQR